MMSKAEDTLLEHLAFQTLKFALESKDIPIEREHSSLLNL